MARCRQRAMYKEISSKFNEIKGTLVVSNSNQLFNSTPRSRRSPNGFDRSVPSKLLLQPLT
jgi:hypothetical protein